MEDLAPKRRGRPRKDSSRNNAVGEGENLPANDIRDGETGGNGAYPQADNGGKGEGVSYADLVKLVLAKNSHDCRISCVIHPDAEGVIETPNLGNIRTDKGIASYQLNTGEIILI